MHNNCIGCFFKNDFDKRDAEHLAADPIVMQITMQQRDGRR